MPATPRVLPSPPICRLQGGHAQRHRRSASVRLCLVLLVVLQGCAGWEEEWASEPLLKSSQTPEILTESRNLELPPSVSANRFLSGWWPLNKEGSLVLIPRAGRARLEVVSLESRPRQLVLITQREGVDEVEEGTGNGEVRVRVDGRDIGSFRVAERMNIPLPASLPLGRTCIDLETGETRIAVRQASLTPALEAGEVMVENGDLIQSPNSLVDLVRRVAPGTVLTGRFAPPQRPGPEQSFELRVRLGERAEEQRAFSWYPRRRRGFRILLGEAGGLVRIRLLARGEGSPGRWVSLRLQAPAQRAELASDAVKPTAEAGGAVHEAPRLVIVYVLDALRADYVGHLGGPAEATPTIDRLASEGAAFTRHVSVAPNTMPSTKTLFTGMVFLTQGGWKLPAEGPDTLAERFAKAGYRTGLFTGNGNLTPDRGLTRGFETSPSQLLFGQGQSGRPYNDNAEQVHEAALGWLDRLREGERAFLFIQTVHPHNPYDPPEPYRSEYTAGIESTIDGSTRTLLDIKHGRRSVSEADQQRLRGLYLGGLAYNDSELGKFMDRIPERYPPESVLLVVTSDHGEELFDHGGVLHGYSLYDHQLRIPLLFWWPGRILPARIDALTDNADLHATLLSLVGGADGPDIDALSGRSLWPLIFDQGMEDRTVQFGAASSLQGGIFMAQSRRYKVIWAPRTGSGWGMGEGRGRSRDVEYLFDLETDPDERTNLAGDDVLEAAWLRSLLLSWVELGREREVGAPIDEESQATRESLRALGYL